MVGGADLYEGRNGSGNKEGCQDLAKVIATVKFLKSVMSTLPLRSREACGES